MKQLIAKFHSIEVSSAEDLTGLDVRSKFNNIGKIQDNEVYKMAVIDRTLEIRESLTATRGR